MSNLADLVPPLELCKMIPDGEFEESYAIYVYIYGWLLMPVDDCASDIKEKHSYYRAPTLEEILEELRKNQEDVFLKWSETAYNAWLVNAYTHDKEDYQDHNSSAATAALTVWLKMKGKING